tara:strand:+ start:219 stop:1418 length:1200 start_codon:yes stop_codon:yes gene_type:complete
VKEFETLPSWTYTNETFFELEKKNLFLNNWQLICHVSNINDPGDYFTFDIFNERLIAVRNEDNEINVFHNVCSHRATKLLDDTNGNCGKRINCPYHAWSYDLSGNLKNVPHQEQFKNFNKADNGLRPVEMEIFQGFIFAKILANNIPSVADQFKPYLKEIEPYNFESLQPLGRVTMRHRDVNWKQIADNYVDAMHIPIAHPGLSGLVGNSYGTEVSNNGGYIHKMWGDLNKTRKNILSNTLYKNFLPKVKNLSADKQMYWAYYRLWPNLAFDVYPDQMDFMQFIPISASKTIIREIPFALKDDRREMQAARYLNWRINRQVNSEDTQLINWVQEGMETSGFNKGPLAESEVCLIDSNNKIRKAIPVANKDIEPSAKEILSINTELLERNISLEKIQKIY